MALVADETEKWNDDEPGNEFRIADYDVRAVRIQRMFLPPGIELNSPEYWDYMRSLTPAERFQQSSEMTDFSSMKSMLRLQRIIPIGTIRNEKLNLSGGCMARP